MVLPLPLHPLCPDHHGSAPPPPAPIRTLVHTLIGRLRIKRYRQTDLGFYNIRILTLDFIISRACPFKSLYKVTLDIMIKSRVCKIFWQGLRRFKEFQFIYVTTEACQTFGVEGEKCTKLSFNYNEFKIRKDHLPLRAIQITKKKPEWRTEKEIKLLQNCLQLLESYRNYSPNLQHLLAKVIRFESFGRRRVIIKKGHYGNTFYFIYFGTVAVTEDEDGNSAFLDGDPTLLRKGAAFGEIALLKGTRRVATVVCMEETELLVVDKEDFFANRLDEELQKELQYRYTFFKGLDLFRTWPEYSIEKIANHCRAEKFHDGQVIVRDIVESTSIIFITKGTCEVLHLVDLTACPSYHKWICQQMDLPKYNPHSTMETGATGRKKFNDFMWKSFPVQDMSNLKSLYILPLKHHRDECFKKPIHFINGKHENINRKLEKRKRDDKNRLCRFDNSFIGDEGEREVVQNEVLGLIRKKLTILTPCGELPTALAAAVYTRVDEVHAGEFLVRTFREKGYFNKLEFYVASNKSSASQKNQEASYPHTSECSEMESLCKSAFHTLWPMYLVVSFIIENSSAEERTLNALFCANSVPGEGSIFPEELYSLQVCGSQNNPPCIQVLNSYSALLNANNSSIQIHVYRSQQRLSDVQIAFFVLFSSQGISQHLLPEYMQDKRCFVLVSQGAEIIRLKKDRFEELADDTTIMKLHKIKTTYPSDDELCQKFLKQNNWKMFRKDLVNFILNQKFMMMASPPSAKPKEDANSSWSVNRAGVLDLAALRHPASSGTRQQQHKFVPVQTQQRQDSQALPNIELRLIHGIALPRPSLKGLF
ncbi:PREDICTED: cyclic nucleotide-binding domain-containing protein 2 [Gavialis gangeticus]|uniref:cyclic nucleotide-binding domain-containing protein 2 n=1 Tax=Gavialis gangeticus TaxID=94835 RepID=UPI00092F508D|nr:PREDICTED: cyclic nucleotide-binding domain-containing protein 2 [Gavialis gangeticus]